MATEHTDDLDQLLDSKYHLTLFPILSIWFCFWLFLDYIYAFELYVNELSCFLIV